MKKSFSRFESAVQQLVEGSFKRLFRGRLEPVEVAARLMRAMEDSTNSGQVADAYTIFLHPDDLAFLHRHNPNLAADLTGYVLRLAKLSALHMQRKPEIVLQADASLAMHQVKVMSRQTDIVVEPTQRQSQKRLTAAILQRIQRMDAYLIRDGRFRIPLDKPFISIGRRSDNDVVLDESTVSRQHALIRWRYGRFVLYNVSQRGRTGVNGTAIAEYVLQPGDVITISDIPLIYGEGQMQAAPLESDSLAREEQTRLLPPLPSSPDKDK